MNLLDDVLARFQALPETEQERIKGLALHATRGMGWVPNPGPQEMAYRCDADELLYGGEAGGGKSDLILGLAVNQHKRSLVLRRINKDAVKLVPRLVEILGSRDGYNGQLQAWRLPGGKQIDIGGCEQDDDKQRYKGDPHDLIGFDELSDFLESQYTFIIGWNRSTNPAQRCRVVGATNPPTSAQGLWIVKRWAPWLDQNHPNPARPGELRWFLTLNGEDTEVDGPGPHMVDGKPEQARSRTFIPASLDDNPDLARTNYSAVLAGLPEELRRAYKDGDWTVGQKDAEWQVIPTAWIEAAQRRHTEHPPAGMAMAAMAVDVAGGGTDKAVISSRHGGWYGPLVAWQGPETADPFATAGRIVQHSRDNCPVVIDMGGGYGGGVYSVLQKRGIAVAGYRGSERSGARTKDGKLNFINKRAEAWWRLREALDPSQDGGSDIALPLDAELKADLSAPRWELTTRGIKIEEKDEIKKRIGRSPDKGDAVVMCFSEGTRAAMRQQRAGATLQTTANRGYDHMKRSYQ